MFPIRDHNPTGQRPFVVYFLIAANLLVFLFMLPIYGDEQALFWVYHEWGLVPAWASQGMHLSGFLTSMFIHGGVLHLAGNMLFLWIFGDNIEAELGHMGFLVFYLAAGLGAALLHIFPDPASQIPMIGASGAIAGVMGGYLLLFPKARVDVFFFFVVFFRIFPLPAWIMLMIWFAIQIFNGVITTADASGIAYWAHAGGFIVGFLWVIPKWLSRGGTRFWAKTNGHPPHPAVRYRLNESRIPKISRRR